MDFLSNLAKSGEAKPSSDQPNTAEKHSNSDLFGSAKVVAEAAQAQLRNEPDKYDKTKAAAAAADLLDAASEYGKLDETKGAGKYVDQAEGYLRQYGGQKTAHAGDSGEEKKVPAATTGGENPLGGGAGDSVKKGEEFLNKPSDGGAGAGGAGEYLKKAEEFLNKPSGDGGEKSEGGGYGDLLKSAGGFLNK